MSFHCPTARGEGCKRPVLGFGLYTQLGEHWVKLLAVTVLFKFPSLLLVQRLSSPPAPFNIWTVNQVKMRGLSWSHRLWLLCPIPVARLRAGVADGRVGCGQGCPWVLGSRCCLSLFPFMLHKACVFVQVSRRKICSPTAPRRWAPGILQDHPWVWLQTPPCWWGATCPSHGVSPPKLGASSPLPMSCLCRRRALPDGRSPQADPEPAGGDGECPSPSMLGSLPGHGLC